MNLSKLIVSFTFFVLTFSISVISNADTGVALGQIDTFLGSPKFEEAFNQNQSFDIELFEDNKYLPDDRFQTHCELVLRDPATAIVTAFNGGRKVREEALTKSQWEGIQGNLLRLIFRNIESYGFQISAEVTGQDEFSVFINGVRTTVPVYKVRAQAINQSGSKFDYEFKISKDLGGYNQVVQKVENQYGAMALTRTTTLLSVRK